LMLKKFKAKLLQLIKCVGLIKAVHNKQSMGSNSGEFFSNFHILALAKA